MNWKTKLLIELSHWFEENRHRIWGGDWWAIEDGVYKKQNWRHLVDKFAHGEYSDHEQISLELITPLWHLVSHFDRASPVTNGSYVEYKGKRMFVNVYGIKHDLSDEDLERLPVLHKCTEVSQDWDSYLSPELEKTLSDIMFGRNMYTIPYVRCGDEEKANEFERFLTRFFESETWYGGKLKAIRYIKMVNKIDEACFHREVITTHKCHQGHVLVYGASKKCHQFDVVVGSANYDSIDVSKLKHKLVTLLLLDLKK